MISASRNKETLQIVPLTSKAIERDRGQFSIGKVTNFITSRDNQVKESFVYVNKITEVTRRKIKLWFQKDSTGKPVKNSSNKNVAVKVDDVQMNRIREGVELVLLHKENYLLNIIKGVHVSYLPVKSTNDDIFKLGYRLVPKDSKIVSNDEILINCSVGGKEVEIRFKKFDRTTFDDRSNFSDETIKYHKNHIERRNEILKGLFSQNLSMVNKAKVFLPD